MIGLVAFAQEGDSTPKIIFDGIEYESYGEEFQPAGVLNTKQMLENYEAMAIGDSLQVVFKGKVNSVCKSMGCWVRIGLDESENESFVKFKDHEFFVPLSSEDADAVVNGYAFIKETTVDQLRHYAEDAGKSEEEINAITEPKIEYTFTATGILLKQVDEEQ